MLTPEALAASGKTAIAASSKYKVAMVGTGDRGTQTWGKDLLEQLPDDVEMVGLCDINPKRVKYAKKFIGIGTPTYVAYPHFYNM